MVLGVFFGSRSCEHDVSIVTALQAIQNIDMKHRVVPVYIDREGAWWTGDGLLNVASYSGPMTEAYEVTRVIPAQVGDCQLGLYKYPLRSFFFKQRPLTTIDVALPAFHGVNGEDGSIQGMFELFNVPYACPGITGSAVGMDKIIMKTCFQGAGLPVLPYCWFTRGDWDNRREEMIGQVEKTLAYPVYVKPANLGSSIGISKAKDREGLIEAVEVAKAYDRKILVEQGLEQLDEINCAALGYGDDVTVSLCEQPVSWESFLTFDEKYMRGGKGSKGMQSLRRKIPAPISEELTVRIQQMTADVFKRMDMKGVIRVDYMISKADGTLYINEVNTIPGSLAFYLFEPMGIPYRELLERMVDAALKAHKDKQLNNFSYDSQILSKLSAGGGLKGGKLGGKMGGKA